MKIDMNALHCITKLSLNWFYFLLFRFQIRANLPELGAGPAIRGKVDLCTARRGVLNRQRK